MNILAERWYQCLISYPRVIECIHSFKITNYISWYGGTNYVRSVFQIIRVYSTYCPSPLVKFILKHFVKVHLRLKVNMSDTYISYRHRETFLPVGHWQIWRNEVCFNPGLYLHIDRLIDWKRVRSRAARNYGPYIRCNEVTESRVVREWDIRSGYREGGY